jgi:hypothetical protein
MGENSKTKSEPMAAKDGSTPSTPFWRRRWVRIGTAVALLLAAVCGIAFSRYHRAHPLVFGESFLSHEHCITQAGSSLLIYASDHGGRFPYHTNGFGDALLLVQHAWLPSFTGPGHSTAVFENARANGTDVNEAACGRIYVQGLSESNSHEIALLFDRTPSPGDHLHGFARMSAPLVREVGFRDGSHKSILVSEWAEFAKTQIQLLEAAGIPREIAEDYYSD